MHSGMRGGPHVGALRRCSFAITTVKIAITYFGLILLLTACGDRDKQLSDVALRERLTGTWNVKVLRPDGSSDTYGTFTVAADDSFRSELVTSVSNEMRSVTLQGFVRVRDGFLIETTTNAVPHWLSEGKRGTLPPGGANSRTKIVRLDDHELVIETNQFGRVLYTKAGK